MGSSLQIPDATGTMRLELSDALNLQRISIAVVDPDHEQRRAAARVMTSPATGAVRQIPDYLTNREDALWLIDQGFDTVAISLDGDPDQALDMVESLCAVSQATVIVYSAHASQDLLMNSMRAGAREFLLMPFDPAEVTEALMRAAARLQMQPAADMRRKTADLHVFLGAKGGSGVTTVSCNFAVSLARESAKRTLFIDLDLPLGDAALDLGITARYSTVNALEASDRLDSTFLATLLVQHSSGLFVLAAPGKFPHVDTSLDAINKLLSVASLDFDHVVVDAGSRLDLSSSMLFEKAAKIYLVAQAGIPELRNANRLITGLLPSHVAKLEVVLNRYAPKMFSISDEAIEKALTKAPKWLIPSDFLILQRMQNTASSLMAGDNSISRIIRRMARTASGLSVEPEKKKGFALFS
jgi:pilus assembly protein CpaE